MRGEKVGSLGADEHELGATLREWAVLTKSYFDEEKDSPFVYREETNVSLLVAAAWKTGCLAISEFQHKHRKKGKRDRIVDASVLTGPIGSRTEWFIEAKMCWPVIHEYSKLTVEIRKSVRAAWNQLNKLELSRAHRLECIALVFFVPEVPEAKARKDCSLLKADKTLELISHLEPTATAWSFPAEKMKDMASYTRKDKENKRTSKYLRPGVVAAMFSYERMAEMFSK